MTPLPARVPFDGCFDRPVTVVLTALVAAVLILAPLLVLALGRLGRLGGERYRELLRRCGSWGVIAALLVGAVLAGTLWIQLLVLALGLLCYREYARATGLFRERGLSVLVVLGILAVHFAVADRWYGLFTALWPITISVLAAAAVLRDRPEGYIQRVSLAVFAYALFGAGLGHLGYLANAPGYRPVLLWLLVATELNDVFAYLAGSLLGRRRLAPRTSPNKTVAGAVGALLMTTALAAVVGHFVFEGTRLDAPLHLLLLGLIISVAGQLGDLMLSSIKRDLGIKDMARTIPGHGGLLDRFDSLLLVAPAVFHYVRYFHGIAGGGPARILTGG